MLSPASKPLVVFSNIDKTYDGRTYVTSNLNFEIEEGEFLTIARALRLGQDHLA